jgi:hypothetical protein
VTRLLALLLLFGCTSKPPIEHEPVKTSAREAASVVVLLSANRDRHPCCSAASVLDLHGRVVLVTAAHCVLHKINQDDPAPDADTWAHVGDRVFYVPGGSSALEATVSWFDAPRDRAILKPVDGEAPPPLPLRKLCDRCQLDGAPVHAVSALFEQTRSGTITGKSWAGFGSRFWESDMSIIPGWSGSPVLDEAGEVVGIVAKCNGTTINAGDQIQRTCTPHWAIFTDVPLQ